jgi:hypothetical protein
MLERGQRNNTELQSNAVSEAGETLLQRRP